MKYLFALVLFTFLSSVSFAQDFKVPENYKLEKPEDYAKYQDDFLKCYDWILRTPVNQQGQKRAQANAFILSWISGSPDVTVEINAKILTFIKTSPQALIIFMGGWATNSIKTEEYKNKIDGTMAGLEAVMTFYGYNKLHTGKDKNIEKYLKMKEKGTLLAYVQKNA